MPFVDKIVEFINQSLKASSLKGFLPAKYYGISTVIARPSKTGGGLELLPGIEENGNYTHVLPDDRYPLTVYHKVISNQYASAKQQSFGDDYVFKNTTELNLVVIADSKKLKLTAEQLEPLFIYGMPQRLGAQLMQELKLGNCLITPTGSVMDKVLVFRQEYPGTEFFLKPNHILFLIRYRIETTFDKNCVKKCLCGDE